MGFFDETIFGKSQATKNRHNERYKRIVKENISHIHSKRVLDLASHNGLWSYAVLESGANYVLGIEGRKSLIDEGLEAFSKFESGKYEFICGDIFNVLENFDTYNQSYFDTILCLGVFYHIMDHYRLMQLMTNLKPKAIILDTGVMNTRELMIKCFYEETDQILNAIAEREGQNRRLIGFPSIGLVHALAESCGYSAKQIGWRRTEVDDVSSLGDYFNMKKDARKRATFILTPKES